MNSTFRGTPLFGTGAAVALQAARRRRRIAAAGPRFILRAVAFGTAMAWAGGAAAAPVGGVVAAGSARVSTQGDITTVVQTSANAAINWQSFSVGAQETVRFAAARGPTRWRSTG